MKTTKAAAIFVIIVGISMLGMWGGFYLTNNIPEIETKPIELAFHLIAEFITAFLLIIAGVGVLNSTAWGKISELRGAEAKHNWTITGFEIKNPLIYYETTGLDNLPLWIF